MSYSGNRMANSTTNSTEANKEFQQCMTTTKSTKKVENETPDASFQLGVMEVDQHPGRPVVGELR